jgi:signal peptidase II
MDMLHPPARNSRRDIVFGSIAVLVIIADQLAKWWIKTNLAYGDVWFNSSILQIIHVQNTGASFGLFKQYTWVIIAVVFIEIAVILVIVYLFRNRLAFMDSMFMRVGVGLIMGGAIGNQIDRILQGHVTDFIDFRVWPVFNVADMSAVTGTIIIAYCILFKSGLMKSKNEQK